MLLNFLSGPLDSRITFSRGSNATLVDSTGRVTYAPANLATFSEQFDNAAWSKVGNGVAVAPTVSANAGTAPDGTATADRVQFNCVDTASSANRSYITPLTNITSPIGTRFVASVWVKAFDTANVGKTIRFTCDTIGNLVHTLTDSWQRISVSGTSIFATTNFLLETRGTFTTQTADILVWGAQFEPVTYQTTPSTYVATAASAYYGPRFDYDPVTLAPRGLLIEEQRTNLTLHSGLTSANWTATGGTLTNTGKLSPDGSSNMGLFTEDSATSAHQTFVTTVPGTLTLGVTYTGSVYIAAGTRRYVVVQCGTNGSNWGVTVDTQTWTITGDFATGGCAFTSASIVNAGNGIYRVTATGVQNTGGGTPAYVVVGGSLIADAVNSATSYLGNGSTFYAWGAQLEAGAFATSYIPTVASTVTRSADVATMTGTNFSSWYNQSAGTFIAEASAFVPVATTTNAVVSANDNTGSNRNNVFVFNGQWGGVTTTGGVDQANILIGASYTPTAVAKIAYAYQANNFAASVNGGTVGTDVSGTVPTVDRLFLGVTGSGGGAALNGHVRQIAYYNSRLPNAQLQTLTAPTLALPLSLDFTTASYTVGY